MGHVTIILHSSSTVRPLPANHLTLLLKDVSDQKSNPQCMQGPQRPETTQGDRLARADLGPLGHTSSVEMTMCGSTSPLMLSRGELRKKGRGWLWATAGYPYDITSKPKRLLFRPALKRRWKWTFSLLLQETEASSAREWHRRAQERECVFDQV